MTSGNLAIIFSVVFAATANAQFAEPDSASERDKSRRSPETSDAGHQRGSVASGQ